MDEVGVVVVGGNPRLTPRGPDPLSLRHQGSLLFVEHVRVGVLIWDKPYPFRIIMNGAVWRLSEADPRSALRPSVLGDWADGGCNR